VGDGLEVSIVEEGDVKWDRPTVITGFPGPGFIGENTAMFIVEVLKMREVGHIDSDLIPPMLVVTGQNLRPPFRIHANEEANIVIVVDNQPIPMENHRVLARSLMDWLNEKRVEEVVALDGLPLYDETLEGRVIGYSTDVGRLSKLGRYGVLPLTGGAITGMNAALLEICREWGLPWTGLLAPTRRIGRTNFKGVASIVEVLNQMFDLDIDISVLAGELKYPEERTPEKTEAPLRGGLFSALRRLVG